jgi:hypothetical protein
MNGQPDWYHAGVYIDPLIDELVRDKQATLVVLHMAGIFNDPAKVKLVPVRSA